MGVYLRNHFIADEIDVDVSSDDVVLSEDYRYGFRATGAGTVAFVYAKRYNPNVALGTSPNDVRTRTLTAGEEFFGNVAVILNSGTSATGITAFAAQR